MISAESQIETLTRLEQEIEDGLKDCKHLLILKGKIQSFENHVKILKSHISSIENQSNRNTVRKKYRKFNNKKTDFNNRYEWLETDLKRNDLLSDHTIEKPPETSSELMQYGQKIQDDSKTSLTNSLATITQTVDLAKKTAVTVDEQKEKIINIIDNTDQINDKIETSRQRIARIGRNMATYRCLWIMIFLIMACIGTIIYLEVRN